MAKPSGEPAATNGAGRGAAEADTTATDDVAAELEKLPPEQVEMFVRALSMVMRKRRLMMVGYAATLLTVLIGEFVALLVWATRAPGSFVGWIFLVPIALAGLILVATARVIRRPPAVLAPPRAAAPGAVDAPG